MYEWSFRNKLFFIERKETEEGTLLGKVKCGLIGSVEGNKSVNTLRDTQVNNS